MIVQGLWFADAKNLGEIPTVSTQNGAPNRGRVVLSAKVVFWLMHITCCGLGSLYVLDVTNETADIVFACANAVDDVFIRFYCCRISMSSVSGSSADDAGSCDDRDANGLEFPASGFGPQFDCNPTATTSAVSISVPSPSYAFRCISSSDSVQSHPVSVSVSSAAATAHDDVEPVAQLLSAASSHSSVL